MKIAVLGAGTAGLIAALILREKYPLYPITVVKSGEIGIIGVGEGSTEHWTKFTNYIGITVEDVVYNTRATFKSGILFKDWNLNEEYIHSIFEIPFTKHNKPDLFNYLIFKNKNSKFPLSPFFEEIFYKNTVPFNSEFKVTNQFHFDTFKLNEFLLKKCSERNINIIDAKVTGAEICSVTGNILELVTENKNIKADFFIDCSGFKRVLADKLENKWISKAEYLPMNHAIAFPTEQNSEQDIEPYTLTTALSHGWAWKIPTQDRYGNGYVFNDLYANADQALGEINKSLNINVEKVARDIKFEAGKIDKFWCKNVVSVGLCGSFAEPLEAQSIGFTIIQMFALIEHMDSWPYYLNTVDNYNKAMDGAYDNIVSYLQLHYLVSREDTKFWKDKPFKITDFNKETLDIFKQGIINNSMFNNRNAGPYNMFGPANWYQVMYGLNLLDKKAISTEIKNNREDYNNEIDRWCSDVVRNSKNTTVISHRDYIKIINDTYKRKYEN
jgi:tryptophan halogenase